MTEDADAIAAALASLWATADPVPPSAQRSAIDAFGWRTIDQHLAQLTAEHDSDTRLAHVRGSAARTLTFAAGAYVVDVQAGRDGRQRRLFGQLDPPAAAEITVESPAGSQTARADDRGRFIVTDLAAPGWIRLAVAVDEDPDGRFATEWFYV